MSSAGRQIVPDRNTLERQKDAANPERSAWVSANAGAGKTWVLATRVIRLLLAGSDPSRILCLTYTKTAAAEMKDRVFKRLGEWVTMPDAQLREELEKLEDRPPDRERLAFARCLFARALETPGGLKIQTIHAFCDALLHRFPLEANVPGHFEQLDDDTIAALIGEARAEMLSRIDRGEIEGVAEAFRTVIELTGESGLDSLLDEAVQSRSKLAGFLRALAPANELRPFYRAMFGFAESETVEGIAGELWPIPEFDDAYADLVLEVGRRNAKSLVIKVGEGLQQCDAESDAIARLELLKKTFLKADGTPKTHNMFPAAVIAELPDYEDRFLSAANRIVETSDRIALLSQIENTLAALVIVDRLLSDYDRLKQTRGYLDFDDLIERTANLLTRPEVAAWVRYKLDQGIDHILVDEAQDTSPRQWEVITTLAEEFFAGETARGVTRTLFAVGDEKQSIYSFQGADPVSFGKTGELIRAEAGSGNFRDVPLDTSFRSTQDVLAAVDKVFETEANRAGVAYSTAPIRHKSLRANEPGRVEVWPMERAQEHEEQEDWTAPVDAPRQPAVIVAERVASTIADWIDKSEIIEGLGRPVTAGDILILVRSRDGFIATLSRALKDKRVEVAGADRLKMTDHIAVLDLLALARFVLQSTDDLSLAALLRSPLFDLSEDDLFAIAYGRDNATLFESLELAAGENPALAGAHARLSRWRERAAAMPVFEFYASILSGEGGREKLVGRLGPETPDMLDEFMRFALAQERAGLPSLQNFVSVLEAASPVIKREMDPAQNQVRIMTVHGAKGLEAPVVFLIDRGSPPYSAQKADGFLEIPVEGTDPVILWNATSKLKSAVTEEAKDKVARRAAEEYRRLLYVGMTRAADRLIVAGYAGPRGGGDDTWRAMVESALQDKSQPVAYPDFEALRFQVTEAPPLTSEGREEPGKAQAGTLPEWFRRPVPAEPPLPRPLAPSGASGMAIEREDDTASSPGSPSLLAASDEEPPSLAVKRGIAMHRLLQMLPAVDPAQRRARAADYCRRFEHRWRDADIATIVEQALVILDDPQFTALFGENAAAEVPVMGTLEIGGEKRAISGVIDRIAVTDDRVLLVDYKTNAFAPAGPNEVPDVYLRQMALYRALVQPLYPNMPVEAYLLYTAGPRMIALPDSLLVKAYDSFTPK